MLVADFACSACAVLTPLLPSLSVSSSLGSIRGTASGASPQRALAELGGQPGGRSVHLMTLFEDSVLRPSVLSGVLGGMSGFKLLVFVGAPGASPFGQHATAVLHQPVK